MTPDLSITAQLREPISMTSRPFDIRDHQEKLTPAKGRNRYLCPVCSNNNLTIDPKTGKYQCWNGCECKNIRDAIAPLPEKSTSPRGEKIYPYSNRDGVEVIQVVRTDDGNGHKQIFQRYFYRGFWRNASQVPDNVKQTLKQSVLPYRYIQAMKTGDRILVVEGEKCADQCWAMGLPAVTTLGGSDGFDRYGDYTGLFDGKQLILCPDMDQPGVKYAERWAERYPDAQWLYAFPNDPRWSNLPKKDGLDVADWIAQGATQTDLLTAIGGRRSHSPLSSATPTTATDSLPTHPPLAITDTIAAIRQVLIQDLPPAQQQAQKIALRQQSTLQEREFNDLWQVLIQEYEITSERAEHKAELSAILALSHSNLRMEGILHPVVAEPLEHIADLIGALPAALLLTLLPAVATLCQVGTQLELNRTTGFYVLPILYTGIVAESGSGKSPAQKAVLKPLLKMQAEADQAYQSRLEQWEQDCKAAKEAGEALPTKPLPREYFTTDVTREAIAQIQAQQPERGFLGWMDELSAVIGAQNQYRNGRGTDREALLSGRDGTGLKVNRASGKRISAPISAYSIVGGTQPDTLRYLMGDFSDGSGQWARFLWCMMPILPSQFPENTGSSPTERLTLTVYNIYKTVEDFPAITYTLSPEARALYHDWFYYLDNLRLQEPRQALRSCFAKAKANTGEIALLLHLINHAAVSSTNPPRQISATTLQAAIQVMDFCLGQVKLIHSLGDTTGELPPVMADILRLAQRKGVIAARDARNGIRRLQAGKGRKAMTPDQIRELFKELVAMGYGSLQGTGKSLCFSI